MKSSYNLAKAYLEETGLSLEEMMYWDNGYTYDFHGEAPFNGNKRLSPQCWASKRTGTLEGKGLCDKVTEYLWDKLNGELSGLALELDIPRITRSELFERAGMVSSNG